jgi:dipeptidyl aminopeptidase
VRGIDVNRDADNANRMVYDRLRQWLIRAFNGEYLGLEDLKPVKNFVPPEA